MRNGNDCRIDIISSEEGSSYRTYEEWKHINDDQNSDPQASSYRTYEEWKQYFPCFPYLLTLRSYRTYEEWKRQKDKAIEAGKMVLTVPMRNGNN